MAFLTSFKCTVVLLILLLSSSARSSSSHEAAESTTSISPSTTSSRTRTRTQTRAGSTGATPTSTGYRLLYVIDDHSRRRMPPYMLLDSKKLQEEEEEMSASGGLKNTIKNSRKTQMMMIDWKMVHKGKRLQGKGRSSSTSKRSNNFKIDRDHDRGGTGTRAFTVMLPKGHVPPSGSSTCHNDDPNSVGLYNYCHYSTKKP